MTTFTPRETFIRFTDCDYTDLLDILAWADRDQDEMRQLATNDDELDDANENLRIIERMRQLVTGQYSKENH